MEDKIENPHQPLVDESGYGRLLIAGHLLFWLGVTAIAGRTIYLDLMTQLPFWPLGALLAGLGTLWWAQRRDLG